eukprot:TRINITY_DN4947_c0_g6_i1.p1 TRINITY_DN4947_c0_g6~~TRINITY_DN4947_c0_g6_i1.p1  ORF type:complete len:648 (+),score=264.81 TRINITY_DN4947_c0_g6_i1:76-2019(+)
MSRLLLLGLCGLAAAVEEKDLSPPKSAYNYIPGMEVIDYAPEEIVPVSVNSLHSHDALISYEYYSLPVCRPAEELEHPERIGQILMGEHIELSLYELTMRRNESCRVLQCTEKKPLSAADLKMFEKRINNGYRGNFVIDNLPVTGTPGGKFHLSDPRQECLDTAPRGWPLGVPKGCAPDGLTYINNHLVFKITVNEHQPGRFIIVQVNVDTHSVDLKDEGQCNADFSPYAKHEPLTTAIAADGSSKDVTWTYGVEWYETKEVGWANRWDSYLSLAYTNKNSKAHLMAIMNTLLVNVLLSLVLAMIVLRALHIDFNRYNNPESEEEQQEEMGWKLVSSEVFRPPEYPWLFSAVVATGSQLMGMVSVVLVFACLGFLSPANRGALVSAAVLLFVLMAVVNGTVMGSILSGFNLKKWKYVFVSGLGFPSVLFTCWCVFLFATLATRKNANTVPFVTVLTVVGLWLGLSLPLVLVGAAGGFKFTWPNPPCRVAKTERPIPEKKWFLETYALMVLPGLIPFGAAFAELRFIMFSMWQGLVYYVFGFLAITTLAVLISAAEIAIVGVYSSLVYEDHKWWWKSVYMPGGIGIWFFLYSVYYYVRVLNIKTWLAALMYFETMFCISLSLWLAVGSIGFFASVVFVHIIYNNIKHD